MTFVTLLGLQGKQIQISLIESGMVLFYWTAGLSLKIKKTVLKNSFYILCPKSWFVLWLGDPPEYFFDRNNKFTILFSFFLNKKKIIDF